jgi:CO/xanthine dehydrogenase Mo-binding subunit
MDAPRDQIRSVVGARALLADGASKVRGAVRYEADVPIAGLLHARLVLSPEAHALIQGIEIEEARSSPGVVAVLTADRLPIMGQGVARRFEPLAKEEVVYAGQPVAMVIAESEAAAEDAAELVGLELVPLDAVIDLELASVVGAPRSRVTGPMKTDTAVPWAHPTAEGGDQNGSQESLSENVTGTARVRRGDLAAAFAESDAVVAGRFCTNWVYQAHIEPQVGTAWIEPGGELVVEAATQAPFYVRSQLAEVFGLPLRDVRVRPAPIGGGFGAKFGVIEPLVAAAALSLKRPVRLTFTRTEDFVATNPAPATLIELRIGGRSNGELTGLEARVLVDRGANYEWGLEEELAFHLVGPYRWSAFDLRGYGVQTNRTTWGSYRGPGGAPAAFARESLLDELAAALGLDPLEVRLVNAVQAGDPSPGGRPLPPFGIEECLKALQAHPIWRGRTSLPPGEGVGVAAATWGIGSEPVAAACRLDADGGVTIVSGTVDLSGAGTAMCQIAAEVLAVPVDRVRFVVTDTASAPHGGISGGSKVTYTLGPAVHRAATAARDRLIEAASRELETSAEDLELADGVVQTRGVPDRGIPIAELARRGLEWGSRSQPIEGHGGSAQTAVAVSVAAHLSHVRVDPQTGLVTPLHHVVAQDVGAALNPALVEGQMHGGVVQGLGWALHEELEYDLQGQLLNGSLAQYGIPTASEVPPIETIIVEVPAEEGPFGAKGVGEVPVLAAPAAVANAITAAVGVRVRELPMTPERLWKALATRQPPAGEADPVDSSGEPDDMP